MRDTKPEVGLVAEGQVHAVPLKTHSNGGESPLFQNGGTVLMELINKKQTFLKGLLVEDAGDTRIVTPKGAHKVGLAHICVLTHTHTHTYKHTQRNLSAG